MKTGKVGEVVQIVEIATSLAAPRNDERVDWALAERGGKVNEQMLDAGSSMLGPKTVHKFLSQVRDR